VCPQQQRLPVLSTLLNGLPDTLPVPVLIVSRRLPALGRTDGKPI